MMTQVTMYLNGFWSFVRLRMRVVRLRKCVEISPCQTGLHNPVSPLIHFCMLEILILILFLKRLTYHVTVSSDSCLYRLFYHIWNLHNSLNSNLKTFQGFTSSTTNWVSSVGWSPMMSVNIILVERKCNKSKLQIFTKMIHSWWVVLSAFEVLCALWQSFHSSFHKGQLLYWCSTQKYRQMCQVTLFMLR